MPARFKQKEEGDNWLRYLNNLFFILKVAYYTMRQCRENQGRSFEYTVLSLDTMYHTPASGQSVAAKFASHSDG